MRLKSQNPMSAALTVNDLTNARGARLLEEGRETILKFVRSKVRDIDLAEDIVQDTLFQLVRAVDASEAIEDVGAWLYHAARNRVIDWYRRRKPERLTDDHTRSVVGTRFDGEATLEQAEIWEAFMDALADLPDKQRDVFIMHELEGMSFKDIQDRTGENLNTLLARKRYAVLALRKRLQFLYEE